MYANRKTLYAEIEKARDSKLLVFVTGDRPGLETQISSEVYDLFVNQLDRIGVVKRISLYLYTRGGATLAAWSIINLIRQFCDEVEAIVPSKAHSAGTLMCLGANKIVMTKQATLGPIDPSITTALNPQVPGGPPDAKVPVSVEAIKGFLELGQEELSIKSEEQLSKILLALADKVHPLVLGEVYRSKGQIQMLARKLINHQVQDPAKVAAIVNFLCSESGSHDYTIHRREARDALGLTIEKPDTPLYTKIKQVYDDIEQELSLSTKLDPNALLGQQPSVDYTFRRALIESLPGGSDAFISEGTLLRGQVQIQPGIQHATIQDRRNFEGWRHENA